MKRYLETGNFAVTEGAISGRVPVFCRVSHHTGH